MFTELNIFSCENEVSLSGMQKMMAEWGNAILGFLPSLLSAAIILLAGLWGIRLVVRIMQKALSKSKADHTIVSFLTSVVRTVLYIVLAVSVLSALRFNVSTLITALGAAAVTVGLALRDSLANVASGTLIILNRKFKTGDFIETEGIVGEVMRIDIMNTTLRTYDHKEVVIPNSRLSSNNIINHFSLEDRRIEIPVPVSYKEDIADTRKAVMKAVEENPLIMKDDRNRVIFQQFGSSSLDLVVWAWCRSEDYWPALFSLREDIRSGLLKAGIEVPFDQLDVHLEGDPAEMAMYMEYKAAKKEKLSGDDKK